MTSCALLLSFPSCLYNLCPMNWWTLELLEFSDDDCELQLEFEVEAIFSSEASP